MEIQKPTLVNQGLKFGLIMGFIQIAVTLLLYIIDKNLLVDFKIIFVLLLLAIVLMVLPVRAYKKQNNGSILFSEAFYICLIAIAGGTLLGNVFSYFLYNIIDPTLPEFIKEQTIEKTVAFMERMGTPQEDIEKGIAPLLEQDFNMTPAKLGGMFFQSVLFGAIPALIIAAIMRTRVKPLDDIQ